MLLPQEVRRFYLLTLEHHPLTHVRLLKLQLYSFRGNLTNGLVFGATSQMDQFLGIIWVTTPSTSLCAGANKVIFLQTAFAKISNPQNPSHPRTVMDGGSQKSYLTERFSVTATEGLSIAAFGSTWRETNYVKWCVLLSKSNKNHELNLFVVPRICDPLTTPTVNSCSKTICSPRPSWCFYRPDAGNDWVWQLLGLCDQPNHSWIYMW